MFGTLLPKFITVAVTRFPKALSKQYSFALTVFNHDAWPTDMEALLDFGREKVERLINWFKVPLVSSGCNAGAIQPHWLSLKILVHSEFMDKGYNDLWATLMTKEPYKSPSASLQRTISSSPKQGLKVAIIVIKCDAESS